MDGVDIDIKEGQFVAILGHNGSGKSTFAKHINALLLPSDGTIWIDGINTSEEPELWKVRQKAGMVFQNPDNQIIGTVVEEDVGFGPENMGVPTEDIWKRVNESLEKTGMTAYRHHSPNKLSGGQKQRVAIAGVMAIVLITHYMEEVIDADHVIVMDGGHVVMEGTPREIFSQVETLKKYRLDVPQVTLLAHELKQSGVDIPDGILTTEELVNALCQ